MTQRISGHNADLFVPLLKRNLEEIGMQIGV
jgi:hypothetical protein